MKTEEEEAKEQTLPSFKRRKPSQVLKEAADQNGEYTIIGADIR